MRRRSRLPRPGKPGDEARAPAATGPGMRTPSPAGERNVSTESHDRKPDIDACRRLELSRRRSGPIAHCRGPGGNLGEFIFGAGTERRIFQETWARAGYFL